jgi:hypothetical protein
MTRRTVDDVMTPRLRRLASAAALALCLLGARTAAAHLVAAQHGTIHFVDDGAFLVLSLPVSAFPGVDADGSGDLDGTEWRLASASIEAQVRRGLQLRDEHSPRPLEGLLLSASPVSDEAGAPVRQVVVLGRFALDPSTSAPLRLALRLQGTGDDEQTFEIIARRGDVSNRLRFDPEHPELELFSAPDSPAPPAEASGSANDAGEAGPGS